MRGRIERAFSISQKISLFNSIKGIELSKSEMIVLESVIKYSINNSVTVDPELILQIKEECNITTSTFNTSVHRLSKKGCLKKEGKTIVLSPLYNNILNYTEITFKFK